MFKRPSRTTVEAASPSTVETAQPQVYRKPKADVYTLMLSIALIVIVLATYALWMVMKNYEYKINGGPSAAWLRPAAPASFDPPREVV